MKTIILILLFSAGILAQSNLLLLMNSETGLTPYPITADLVASYDENEMTISNWSDQTGTNDFLQGTVGLQPSLIAGGLNGYPALRFNGDVMGQGVNMDLSQPITIYFVMKLNSWTDGEVIMASSPFICAEGGGADNVYINAGTDYSPIRSFSAGSFRISAIVLNGASSLWQVNDDVATGNPGTSGFTAVILSSTAKSDFVCIYIHSTAHNLATRTQIIDWLNSKYEIY